ncbi:DUF418 domain-containing protein [Sphingomonas sp.]|uniref:DUF418 domain-containing protein n=1 Tax=Sphingomonas sp. TaxID=28214 RepID=UPI001ECD0B5D|nr:DUF418 domain-containing protein [Sphingomonas sp.]MBX3595496.1 DUF418 domain-containing protein [Sphingomonas sp.]
MASTAPDRFLSLDVVRGVAVMGILLLNIVAFSMPLPAYFNPTAYGGATGLDLAVYLVNFILFDGKMRGLFSLLFGASLLLVTERAAARGDSPAKVHFARMTWLLVFGLLHLWLIWWGDILSHYALVGMIAFFCRRMDVRSLITLAAMLLLVQLLASALIPLGVAQAQAAPTRPEAVALLRELDTGFGQPPQPWLAADIAAHRADWIAIARDAFAMSSLTPLHGVLQYGYETLAYMLLGMAAWKSGMLAGNWTPDRYRRWAIIGLGLGVAVYTLLAAYMVSRGFDLFSVTLAAWTLAVPIRPVMILGWASLILLAMRPGGGLTGRLAAAGRMAFSNYLLTSVVCTMLFYGYGFGWYGALTRAQLYPVVIAIWCAMLLWSKPWLDRFAYGPLEWAWRSLSRGAAQQLRRSIPARKIANASQ